MESNALLDEATILLIQEFLKLWFGCLLNRNNGSKTVSMRMQHALNTLSDLYMTYETVCLLYSAFDRSMHT